MSQTSRLTSKLITRVDHRLKHGYENCETLEGQERSVCAFKHDTVNLSFMYTDLSTEVKLMTSLIVVFAWHPGLAKEASGIDEQKKQFQLTGLTTVEVMNDIFLIENGKICSINIHKYHFQAKWVEYFRSYIFYECGKHQNFGVGVGK